MARKWYKSAESRKRKTEASAGQDFLFDSHQLERTEFSSELEIEADFGNEESKKQRPKHKPVNPLTYLQFLNEHDEMGISKDPFVQEARKRALLLKYFDYRFGDDGIQPLNRYTKTGQVGAIYQCVWAQAMKVRRGHDGDFDR